MTKHLLTLTLFLISCMAVNGQTKQDSLKNWFANDKVIASDTNSKFLVTGLSGSYISNSFTFTTRFVTPFLTIYPINNKQDYSQGAIIILGKHTKLIRKGRTLIIKP